MDPLVDRASSTAEQIAQTDGLITYIRLVQKLTVAAPFQDLGHPATGLLENYEANGLPVEFGPEWSLETIWTAIGKGPHSSTLSPESTDFCRKKILEQTQQGFSIILLVTKDIPLFVVSLSIYLLALVDQVNRKPCLI